MIKNMQFLLYRNNIFYSGNIVIKLPLPPGTLLSLYNNHERFEESYMKNVPGYYDTGDAGIIDEGMADSTYPTLLFP